jgi:hypothetical protein
MTDAVVMVAVFKIMSDCQALGLVVGVVAGMLLAVSYPETAAVAHRAARAGTERARAAMHRFGDDASAKNVAPTPSNTTPAAHATPNHVEVVAAPEAAPPAPKAASGAPIGSHATTLGAEGWWWSKAAPAPGGPPGS